VNELLVNLWPTAALAVIGLVILPQLRRSVAITRVSLCILALVLVIQYLHWRLTETMPALALTPASLWPWGYLVFESASCTLLGILLVTMMRSGDRGPEVTRKHAWLAALPRPPLVDVLIPTYNEDVSVLEPTIVGAIGIDHARLRVWVLDDGKRPWLKAYCADRCIRYLDRPDNQHAKAGNLNNGLAAIAREAEQPDFVAVLDADFVPTRRFLQRTLPLFADADVGLVQTPQHFYSDGPIQLNLRVASWWMDEQRQHFDTVLPSRDAWGSAYCCGTSCVVRYDALRRVGGFPVESVTEDYLLTLKLRAAQYRTVYLNERLSHGLAPAGVAEYVGQRARWCLGTMQIARSAWGPFSRQRLPFIYRFYLLEHVGYWAVSPVIRLVYLVAPAVYWFSGVFVMETTTSAATLHLLPFYVGVNGILAWLSGGRILPILNDVNQILVAFDTARAGVVGLFRPKGHRFRVTLKRAVNDNLLVHGQLAFRFGSVLLTYVAGILLTATTAFGPSGNDEELTLAIIWTALNSVIVGLALLACVERPRRRRDERFVMEEPLRIRTGDQSRVVIMREGSLSGLRFDSGTDLPIGSAVVLDIDGVGEVPSVVSRSEGSNLVSVNFSVDGPQRDALILKLFSGRYGQAPEDIGVRNVILALLNWIGARSLRRTAKATGQGLSP
jgi:cellulose synthase (UDP-forming)